MPRDESFPSVQPAGVTPTVGITTGDPCGIGPEVTIRAACDRAVSDICRPCLFGDAEILRRCAEALSVPFDFTVLSAEEFSGTADLPPRCIVHVPAELESIRVGVGSRAGGEAAARNVTQCAEACLRGKLSAMVTAPLNKRFLREAGYDFPGHTEFLAHLAGVREVAMAFLTEKLKVVLVTIHLPLRRAIDEIRADTVLRKLRITMEQFPRFGLPCRSVAVAGLNPHAGESGLLGSEEREHLEPALREARRLYPEARIEGPVPADTLFHRAVQGEFDVVLALFHDQGLSPIKLLGFGEAVNVTLGLPFVRTSVDHGTAFDIAGRGIARADSMISAVRWAVRLLNPDGTFAREGSFPRA